MDHLEEFLRQVRAIGCDPPELSGPGTGPADLAECSGDAVAAGDTRQPVETAPIPADQTVDAGDPVATEPSPPASGPTAGDDTNVIGYWDGLARQHGLTEDARLDALLHFMDPAWAIEVLEAAIEPHYGRGAYAEFLEEVYPLKGQSAEPARVVMKAGGSITG